MEPSVCPECGAGGGLDELSVLCRGCGAPVPVHDAAPASGRTLFLPPSLDRAGAAEALREWAGSRRFAPKALRLVEGPEHLRLTFTPHWILGARATASYRGERGDHYDTFETTQSGGGSSSTRRVRKTRWSKATGEVVCDFAELLVVATAPVHRHRVGRLAPWPLTEVRLLDTPPPGQILYRGLGVHEALGEAEDQMRPEIERACLKDIGGDEQRLETRDITYTGVTHRAVLLPVWTAGYRHAGKAWHVLINAATGEVFGERPYSRWKVGFAIGFGVLVAATLILAVAVR